MNNNLFLLKQAWASLSEKKGFLVVVVTTLGFTVGVLLCILTLAYLVIAKPLPYPEQANLYQLNAGLYGSKGEVFGGSSYNYRSLMHFYENQTLFSQSAMINFGLLPLASHPQQPILRTTFVTPDFFALLGAKMVLGRAFEESEGKDKNHPVAILTYDIWMNQFNSDKQILEKSVSFEGVSFRVIGVLSEAFIEPQLNGLGAKTDIFLPWDYNVVMEQSKNSWGTFHSSSRFIGKLDSTLSTSQVEQTLSTLMNGTWREQVSNIAFFNGWSIKMQLLPLRDAIMGDSTNTVLLLLIGVIGLLLIACANIANLFISRTAEQQRQLAIQAAFGAKKGHLFQTLFTESGLVVFISILLAMVISSGGFWVLQQYLTQRLPRVDELAIDAIMLSAAGFIAILLAVFFAGLSTNMINYRALNRALQASGKGTSIQVSKKVRQSLIVSQVAIATLLVFVNIGLLKDSLKVINQSISLNTEDVYSLLLTFNAASSPSDEEAKALMVALKARIAALPQVAEVAQGSEPFGGERSYGQSFDGNPEGLTIDTRPADHNYFQLLRQPLLEGDYFSAADLKSQNRVIVINDAYATLISPQGSALGSKIKIEPSSTYTVVGIVKGFRMPSEKAIPARAYPLSSETEPTLLIKLKPQQRLSRELVVSTIQAVSKQLNFRGLNRLNKQISERLFTQYTTAITSAFLAALTFFLATIGLYGVFNYATQMRRFELGTRIAIGAKRMDVLGLIIKQNAAAVGMGVIISLVIILLVSISFSSALANYINLQLITLFLITLALIGTMALFSCYWPLRPIINALPIHSLRGKQ